MKNLTREASWSSANLFPHFFRTVYGDPDRYAENWNTIPGVYFTGDVALRDADGYYMVVGRADDVLNVAGHRIGSAEVESALVSPFPPSLKPPSSANPTS